MQKWQVEFYLKSEYPYKKRGKIQGYIVEYILLNYKDI